MKEYKIKVTEKHSDIVHIKAESREAALDIAHSESECEYELLYDCEVLDETEISD